MAEIKYRWFCARFAHREYLFQTATRRRSCSVEVGPSGGQGCGCGEFPKPHLPSKFLHFHHSPTIFITDQKELHLPQAAHEQSPIDTYRAILSQTYDGFSKSRDRVDAKPATADPSCISCTHSTATGSVSTRSRRPSMARPLSPRIRRAFPRMTSSPGAFEHAPNQVSRPPLTFRQSPIHPEATIWPPTEPEK